MMPKKEEGNNSIPCLHSNECIQNTSFMLVIVMSVVDVVVVVIVVLSPPINEINGKRVKYMTRGSQKCMC